MKKFVTPLIASIVVFGLINIIPFKFAVKDSNIILEVSLQVLDDDYFQLFYAYENVQSFSEEYSLRQQIEGNSEIQKLKFEIPVGRPLNKIRLDFGQNIQQRPIKIESVSFRISSRSKSYDFLEIFTPNEYIQIDDGKIITKEVHELKYSYDPYFITSLPFEEIISGLMKKQNRFEIVVKTLIAILFAFITFIYVLKYENQKSLLTSIYIFLFIVVLITPIIVDVFNIKIETKLDEKRELAMKPELKLAKDFPLNFENYFNDNFSLRGILINLSGKLKTQVLNVSSKPELVQIGHDNFLFYNIVYSYSNSFKYSEPEIEKIYEFQEYQMKKLSEKGIKYILGFWPNKHSVYDNKYPYSMRIQIRSDTALSDQILRFFRSKGMNFFDVRADLRESKGKSQVYYKLDTHWNDHGAYEAYKSFCNQTFSELGLKAFDIETFSIDYEKTNRGDLTNMLGISNSSFFTDEIPIYSLKDKAIGYELIQVKGFPVDTEITINKNSKDEKVVLVFHDSFTNALKKILSLHYKKVVYIWSYPVESRPMDKSAIVKQVCPDIIINCCVERYLPDLLLETNANILYK